jgi:arginyl-tRNA synthetase
MTDVKREVETWVRAAAVAALGPAGDVDPLVRASKDLKFGDYQANLAMGLGKQLGQKPRELADKIAAALTASPAGSRFEVIEVAGPGFINLKLASAYVDEVVRAMFLDPRLGVPESTTPVRVVVDYSSPNLAKEMHIGHLRSTIIGDAIVRLLTFKGDVVIRQNHLGDWGTQFGMLLQHLLDVGWDAAGEHTIRDLNELYKEAKQRFDADPDFSERARLRVVALQAGEPGALTLWRQLIGESVRHMNQVYERLGVLLQEADIRGESSFNPMLQDVVKELAELGLLREDQGAQVVFPPGFSNKEGDPLPLIVQKRDGGFGYAATDLAAAKYRISELKADRVVYVVDARQSDHFAMVFSTLRAAGWAPANVTLEHVAFGTILGQDRKPFKSREGGVVRLAEVLDEAAERAFRVIEQKDIGLTPEQGRSVARSVGVGAVKYADLSNERIKDYVFDWDRMLALEGNTAPYLQNAYVRIQSIFRKGGVEAAEVLAGSIQIVHPEERKLALQLLLLPQTIEGLASSLELHRLCGFLYELASGYHSFYEQCSVLRADNEQQKASRLALSLLVARTLRLGLSLLGVEAVEQM